MTPEEFWQSKNGGKPSIESNGHGENITPTYAVSLIAEYAKEKDTRIADLEAKLAQAIEFQKRAFSYGRNGASWEQFFTAQEKEAQESEKGGL